ncbi:MAG: MmgE/PrpD family protein [SAR202 cluster bacterium]|nr:MmgE/PrpD family protein [SAR202 cluster bacterium]HCP23072.1 MmgE/PrpD family protein [Dehalococcoidia bacterium]
MEMVRNNKDDWGDLDNSQITRVLSRFVADLTYEDLSPEVVEWAKFLCLDFAGVTLNGSTTDSANALVEALNSVGRGGPSTVIGTSEKVLPEYAALANGTAFHSIEMDDVNLEACLHPGVTAYPTALAMADVVEVSGKDFITAVVAGYDVIVRLGRGLVGAEHYARGFHPTGTCGAFGAAAVAARLMGLKGESLAHALGIAGSQTSGSMEYLAQGAWTKRLHPGWASHSGIWAALMARSGYTGPTTIIEGRDGFLQAYSDNPEPGLVLKDLGEEYQVTRTSIKPHTCCRFKHGPIDCLLDLKRAYGIDPMDVAEVRVGVVSAGMKLVSEPIEAKRTPKTVVDMQFSMPFGAAVALTHGRASLEEYQLGMPENPAVKHVMERVHCMTDPALDALTPKQMPAWAEVDTNDGRTLRSEVGYPKGDPENPVTWDEMKEKFIMLSSPVIGHERQQEIIAAVESLEQMSDVRQLAELLSTC